VGLVHHHACEHIIDVGEFLVDEEGALAARDHSHQLRQIVLVEYVGQSSSPPGLLGVTVTINHNKAKSGALADDRDDRWGTRAKRSAARSSLSFGACSSKIESAGQLQKSRLVGSRDQSISGRVPNRLAGGIGGQRQAGSGKED
jgi:hypothetical protein